MHTRIHAAGLQARRWFQSHGVNLDHVQLEVVPHHFRSSCTLFPNGELVVQVGLGLLVGGVVNPSILCWVLAHEYAHAWEYSIEYSMSVKDQARWEYLFGPRGVESTAWSMWNPWGSYDTHNHVSWYATTSPHEDFAETTASFLMGEQQPPGSLRAEKVAFIEYLMTRY